MDSNPRKRSRESRKASSSSSSSVVSRKRQRMEATPPESSAPTTEQEATPPPPPSTPTSLVGLSIQLPKDCKKRILDSSHTSRSLASLNAMRRDRHLCDMAIEIEGSRVLWAHKCVLAAGSDYFKTLFENKSFTENAKSEVTLSSGFAPETVDEVLTFLYTGEIVISASNLRGIYQIADYLLLSDLKEDCIGFLEDNISAFSCVSIWLLSKEFNLVRVERKAKEFMCRNFMQIVIESEDFLLFDKNELLEWVNNEYVRITEETMFDVVCRWVAHDASARQEHFKALFSFLRLCLFKLESLINVVKPQEFVVADRACLRRVEEAVQHRILRESGYFSAVERPVCGSCTPRKGTLKDVILLVGGGNTEAMGLAQTWGYVVDDDRWIQLSSTPSGTFGHQMAVLNKMVYLVMEVPHVSHVFYRFDPLDNSWTSLPYLWHDDNQYAFYGIVACDNCLFVFRGGNLYCYDPTASPDRVWTQRTPPRIRPFYCSATVSERFIYLSGWYDGNMERGNVVVERYDVQSDVWTTAPMCPKIEACNEYLAFIESFCDPSMSSTNVAIPELPAPNEAFADSLREKVCRSMPCTFNTKGIASTEHEGNIYVFGGWRKSPGNTKMLDSAFKFDNRRNRWVELAPLPGKRWASACAVTQVPSEFLGAEAAPTDSVNHGGLQPMEHNNDRAHPEEDE